MMPSSWTAPPGVSYAAPPANYSFTNPAYTAVQARQSFSQYPPAAGSAAGSAASPAYSPQAQPVYGGAYDNSAVTPVTPSPPTPRKVEWPPSVREYVQKSFLPANMDPSVSRSEIEAKLKETISQHMENKTLESTNWETMPFPAALVKAERQSQLNSANSSSSYDTRYDSPSANPKKRKSNDFTEDVKSSVPWRSTNSNRSNALEDRVSFASPDKRASFDDALPKSSKFQKQLEKRQRRFDGGYKSSYRSPSPPPSDGPVVGTSETLEKRYLRLTAPPVPSQVRPERVLHKTMDLLKKKWKKEGNYSYICDQLKSMRQDLTVQRIKNDFTVSVYELHARIALEKGDLGEYNQCQTQLRTLYAMALKGNPIEFKAYRILYFIHTANRTGLNDALADLTTAEQKEQPIKHALEVRSALALGNYHKFFQLYLDTPNMGAYLMDMFVVRERLAALCNICKSYKPDVKLRFITEELGFESDVDAAQFVVDYNGQHLLEERQDYIALLTGKAGPLFDSARSEAFRKVDIKGQI
ncbi:THP3-like protein [Colletotrichum orbiculare MAFF 240422]|uniref:THP3-like protein n=1 Tax=Colletotrichum orbiculare (strain 104-T / ATCC 96160 / CBS 514.97 / LARS 414 / MAFF 240422) TaxID=1213857 RepID=N4V822_COLOR|nr:THP3-like protein [Colletotrichum orbiculare MAFF 240422]